MPGAQYKYAGVKSDDVEGGQPARTSSGPGGDDPVPQRMPYFVGTCVLLAIVYVLSRTGAPAGCSTVPGAVPDGFDIDAYREERLAATPPNIIECAEASEGESQEACHLPQDHRYQALSQKGITLWMTGYSGSGKSTIARALEEKLVLEYVGPTHAHMRTRCVHVATAVTLRTCARAHINTRTHTRTRTRTYVHSAIHEYKILCTCTTHNTYTTHIHDMY